MDLFIQIQVENIKETDTSFTEKGLFGITPKFKQSEMRETWFLGISEGLEIGMRLASLAGQKVTLDNSPKTEMQTKFLQELADISKKYSCAVQFHPEHGMCIVDRN